MTSSPGKPIKGETVHIPYDVDGSDVGYRWFARQGLNPLFRFGFGLSYTRFALSDLSVERKDGALVASLTVTNVGRRSGTDTPQIYVSLPGPAGFVPRLAAFARVRLEPGESRRVTLPIDSRLLARYDVARGLFHIAAADYVFDAGEEAGRAILRTNLQLDATDAGK